MKNGGLEKNLGLQATVPNTDSGMAQLNRKVST